ERESDHSFGGDGISAFTGRRCPCARAPRAREPTAHASTCSPGAQCDSSANALHGAPTPGAIVISRSRRVAARHTAYGECRQRKGAGLPPEQKPAALQIL